MPFNTVSVKARSCACSTLAFHSRRPGRKLLAPVQAAIKARWSLHSRFGHKSEVTGLLQEWVRDIGSVAGLTSQSAQLYHGFVGVPESLVQLEVMFDSLSDWECFLSSIPVAQHRAWSLKLKEVVVDASPCWTVMHVYPLHADQTAVPSQQQQVPQTPPQKAEAGTVMREGVNGLLFPAEGGEDWERLMQNSPQQQQQQKPQRDAATVSAEQPDEPVILDWKGEPMKINPGDKLPMFK